MKKRFKSTKIKRRPTKFINAERSKTLEEKSSIAFKNYVINEISASDDSIKEDESECEFDNQKSDANQSKTGKLIILIINCFLVFK